MSDSKLQLSNYENTRICRDQAVRSLSFLEKAGLRRPEIQLARCLSHKNKVIYYSEVLEFFDKLITFLEIEVTKSKPNVQNKNFALIRRPSDAELQQK